MASVCHLHRQSRIIDKDAFVHREIDRKWVDQMDRRLPISPPFI